MLFTSRVAVHLLQAEVKTVRCFAWIGVKAEQQMTVGEGDFLC